jgi:hypothetical protein
MKGKFVLVLGLMLMYGFVSFGIHAQSNEDPKLVGTWQSPHGTNSPDYDTIVVFNSNGTGTWNGRPMVYGAFGGKLAVFITDRHERHVWVAYVFSKDGKTLILSDGEGGGYLLLRQN